MIAIYLFPVYALLNFYLIRRLLQWLRACAPKLGGRGIRIAVSVFFCLLALTPTSTVIFSSGAGIRRTMVTVGNYWIGVLLYALLAVGTADLCRAIVRLVRRNRKTEDKSSKALLRGGAVCLAVIILVSVYGAVNAGILHTTSYEVTVDKQAGDLDFLKVVLLADLHMGYSVGQTRMKQMVEKVNACSPDLVVIAGDIFDNDYDALENPEELAATLARIESKYGIYACYGNHDIEERTLAGFTFGKKEGKKTSDLRMDEFLDQAGIQLLRDESVLIDNSFYLYGRPDYSRPGRGVDVRKTPEQLVETLDQSKPILVIDHQPRELQELADAGVDLDLCGHTHDGQVFPLNLSSRLIWENSSGYLQKGNMHNIVTSGVGLFGPNMRVATIAEICPITVHFG